MVNGERLARNGIITHGGSLQYDNRAPSRVTSIGFASMEGMLFQFLLMFKIKDRSVFALYSKFNPIGILYNV